MSPAQILGDTRFALRLLRRSPAFALTILGVLVVGIGATTAMFSIVMSVLVRSLPYPHPEELMSVWATQPNVNPSPLSAVDFEDWRAQATSFDGMAAIEYDSMGLSVPGEAAPPEIAIGANVSGDYFSVLGIAPLRGRLLGPEDDRAGSAKVAVISAALWHQRFGSNPNVVGRTVSLSGEPFTIVGVAPEGFRFSGPYSDGNDVWTALGPTSEYQKNRKSRGSHYLHAIGRLKRGFTQAAAEAELVTIAASISQAHPDTNAKLGARLVELHEQLTAGSRETIWVLFAAVVLVFLVVCANVANLLLARAATRRAEMATRSALGATPGRLAAQLVTETLVVFAIGGLGGAMLAWWLVDVFSASVTGVGAAVLGVRVDGAGLAFAVVIALVAGLLAGLVPAAEARRVDPQTVLKETGARASVGGAARVLRGGLVVAQVALALSLLAGGGLAYRAYARLAATPLGFDLDVVTASIYLSTIKYPDAQKIGAFERAVVARVADQPGVTSAGGTTSIPMGSSSWNGSFEIEGRPPWPSGAGPLMERNTVTSGYFGTMGIPLLRGRDFNAGDSEDGRKVMVISQAVVDRFFPGEDPIGHRIDIGENEQDGHDWREIVGVVGNVRRLGRTLVGSVGPECYMPLEQHSVRWLTIVARTDRGAVLLHDLPGIVGALDPEQAVSDRRTMRKRLSSTLGPQRFVTTLLGGFSAVALLLATLGLFGLVSYTTSQRTRELGIRLALGSSPEGIIRVVMGEGVRLLAIGLVIGSGGAVLFGRAVADRVAGAAAFDPLVFGVIVAVLGLAGVVASLLPALRAVRIPPAVALRYE